MTDIEYDPSADDIGFDLVTLPRRFIHIDTMGREISFQVEPSRKKTPTLTVWSDGYTETTLVYRCPYA